MNFRRKRNSKPAKGNPLREDKLTVELLEERIDSYRMSVLEDPKDSSFQPYEIEFPYDHPHWPFNVIFNRVKSTGDRRIYSCCRFYLDGFRWTMEEGLYKKQEAKV